MNMIEKATNQDFKQIRLIAITCFDENIATDHSLFIARFLVGSYFKNKNIESRLSRGYELFVLKEEANVVGFIELQNVNHVANLFVLPTCQKKGYGKMLMEFAFSYCRNCGKTDISLDALKNAIRFYSKLGFVSLNRMKKMFGIETYMMKKDLKDD